MTTNVSETLKSNDFFRNIPEEDLELFAAKITFVRFRKDDVIIRKGDEANEMYIILEGNVKIHDGEYVVAELGAGSFFGEMSLLDDGVRSMSVTALVDVELIPIVQDVFFELFRDQPTLAKRIISTITKRLRQQDELVISQLKSREEQLKQLVAIKTEGLIKKNQELEVALQQVKTTQEQLIQQEKLASLGQLTAGIAHEIKNPLNFVNNFAQLCIELIKDVKETADEEEKKDILTDVQQNLEKINQHGKRADGIVQSMLMHSRVGSDEKQPTDINKMCEEFLNLAYHAMRSSVADFNCILEKDLAKNLPDINCVSQDISRVVLNLVTNAFYAVNDKRKEKLALNEEYEPKITVTSRQVNDAVEITVLDNGKGMSEKVKQSLFQPFFTTKPAGKGTGLGLSLSYDIIKTHGGRIRVESEEGQYTAFMISLPV